MSTPRRIDEVTTARQRKASDDGTISPNDHPHADQRNWQPSDDDPPRHVTTDLDRFIRSVRRLNKLLLRYGDEKLAKALIERGITRGLVLSTGEILGDVGSLIPEDPWPKCAVCGGFGEGRAGGVDTLTRANNIYCSPKCRQKAYRARIRKREAFRAQIHRALPRDGKPAQTQHRSVTKTRNVTDSAVNVAGHPSRAPADAAEAPPAPPDAADGGRRS